jgi:hypothetical protein
MRASLLNFVAIANTYLQARAVRVGIRRQVRALNAVALAHARKRGRKNALRRWNQERKREAQKDAWIEKRRHDLVDAYSFDW